MLCFSVLMRHTECNGRSNRFESLTPDRGLGIAMTTTELRFFRERLEILMARVEGKESVLRGELFGIAEEPVIGGIHEQFAADDLSREDFDGEVALSLLGNEREILDECRLALERIENGKFGVCETCSQPITKHRLMALPYARACVACARAAD